jgi:hypothetical protein
MNQIEFAMQVDGVADFYARDGIEVEYAPVESADINSIELYLNGSVYGAVLHQRKILPLHGSSFRYRGSTILICGDAGAGKSSLTASFCLNGAGFLTDDVTPVVFRGGIPHIWAISDRIKLWTDSLEQFGKGNEKLERIYPGMDKYFYPVAAAENSFVRLDLVFFLEISEEGPATAEELTGHLLFNALRGQIYRSEYLQGMIDNEVIYFTDLIAIGNNIRAWSVTRPQDVSIATLTEFITMRLGSYIAWDE